MRSILHCDLNNFYASVACLEHPELRNRPMAVGGNESTRHGIILSKNMAAKRLGIRTGESLRDAFDKCPSLAIVPPNFPLYYEYSAKVRAIYQRYTPLCESFGIDECWLDVTGCQANGKTIADNLRAEIKRCLGLTISVGVSFNKVFAKLGSDLKKPDATTVIHSTNYQQLVWPLGVENLLFVGRSTKRKLNNIGIYTIGQLAHTDVNLLEALLGKCGCTLHTYANGWDCSAVLACDQQPECKSIGNGLTAPHDLSTFQEACNFLYPLCESVAMRLRRGRFVASCIQLECKDRTFRHFSRQIQLSPPTQLCSDIVQAAQSLLRYHYDFSVPLRAIAVRATSLSFKGEEQLSFFQNQNRFRQEQLEYTLDKIRNKYGEHALQRAVLLPLEHTVPHFSSFHGRC